MKKDPRELAARALCRHAGNPENTTFEGRPMWMSYLPEVDIVIAALGTSSPSPGQAPEAEHTGPSTQ